MNALIQTRDPRPIELLLVDDDDGDAKAVRRSFQKAKIANKIAYSEAFGQPFR